MNFVCRTALVNQSEDIPGMNFLNSAFDSSTFIRTNYNYMQTFVAANASLLNPNQASHQLDASQINPINNTSGNPHHFWQTNNADSNPGHKQGGSVVIGIKNDNSGSNLAQNMSTNNNNNNTNSSSNINQAPTKSISSISHYNSVSSKTNDGRTIWLKHLASAAASASAKRAYCSKTQIYCEAISRALDIDTCKVVPFFGAFLHDLRFIIESVPAVNVTCNRHVQKPIEMASKLNGEENYFTRICVGGLLNTRKLELAHMLLQDISMFHSHPVKMPDTALDSGRFIAAAVSNLIANDRKAKAHISLTDSATKFTAASLLTPVLTQSLSRSSSNLVFKSNTSLNKARSEEPHQEESGKQTKGQYLECYIEEVGGLNDLASFISYASRKPSQTYLPIKEDLFDPAANLSGNETGFGTRSQHNVSYVRLDDNPLIDSHVLQTLQNGFTFVCMLNEWEMMQSNCLLNIRLELNNSTLIWSKPAWDITNAWINPTIVNTTVAAATVVPAPEIPATESLKTTPANTTEVPATSDPTVAQVNVEKKPVVPKAARASLINNSLLLSIDNSALGYPSKSERFIKRIQFSQFQKKSRLQKQSTQIRRKMGHTFSINGDHPMTHANKQSRPGEYAGPGLGGGGGGKESQPGNNNATSPSSSFNENDELIYDQIDPNLVCSVSSLNKHYVYHEQVNMMDPNEGFLDLHCVKHIRLGCLDSQLFANMQLIATNYAISNFDHNNIICLIYGTTFSENR